jgi:TP901 family phage tail tape measure protein
MSGTAEMKASLLLTLEDQLSGGVTRLMETIDKLIATTDKLASGFGALGDRLDSVFNKANEKAEQAKTTIGGFERALSHLGETAATVGKQLDAMWAGVEKSAVGQAGARLTHASQQIGIMGGAAAGFGVLEPVKTFAEFENVLRHIAITEGKSGEDVKPEIERLSKLFSEDAQKTGQSSESIAKAYYDLVTMGIPSAILDRVIGAHSQAATAYNISPEALGPAVGALLQNFSIPEADIGSALAAMAQAAKEGRFKVEDFSRELPGVSGFMSTLGMKGREGADISFAALETVMKNASNPGQAAADFTDALNYLTGNAARLAFKKSGVDLPKLLEDGQKAGKNPLDTILDQLAKMTAGQDPVKMAETLHAVLHNQQAEQALMALLQHREEFNTLKGKLDHVDQTTVQRDFNTAVADPITQTRLFNENLQQIGRTIGEGFTPVLTALNGALNGVREGLAYMNEHFPGLTHALIATTGAMLAFVAIVGTLGFVLPVVTAGLTALGAVIEILAVAVPATGGVVAGVTGLTAALEGFGGVVAVGGTVVTGVASLGTALATLAAPLTIVLGMLAGAKLLADQYAEIWKKMTPEERQAETNAAAGVNYEWDLPPPKAAAPPTPPPARVDVHVTADPGLKVQTTSDSPNVQTPPPDPSRDQVLGRP